MDSPIDHLHEEVLVNSLLMGAIGKESKNMDKFSGWLLAGFAAVVAVLFGNLSEASIYLSGCAIQTVFACFFIVAILGIVAKGLAVLVASPSAAKTAIVLANDGSIRVPAILRNVGYFPLPRLITEKAEYGQLWCWKGLFSLSAWLGACAGCCRTSGISGS